jgi:hypothetical protein
LTAIGKNDGVVDTQHGEPGTGGLLDVFWNDRRAEQFDERCTRG